MTSEDSHAALLERALELERVDELLELTTRERGAAVAIEGAPGIGKTSLLAEARRRAESRGVGVLAARGAELERAFSFGIVLSLIDPMLRGMPESEQRELFLGAAGLAQRLFEAIPLGSEPAGDPDSATLYGLYWLVAGLAEERPLLLVIDDLQWADRPTLRFLAFLARRLDGLPIGLLVATRPDVPVEHLALVADIAAEVRWTLRPRPLSRAATEAIVRRRLSGADPALVDVCLRITGGNPFYLAAVLEDLVDRGRPITPAEVEDLLPRTVTLALLRRLATAAADARAAIDTARACRLPLVEATALMNLCWTLVDRDRSDEAAQELTQASLKPDELGVFVGATTLDGRGRVRIALGDHAGGLQDLQESAHRITASGLDNPACFPWRSGSAPALVALERKEEAIELVQEEVRLARLWGTPRALGLALRTLGTLTADAAALSLYEEAADALADSEALLERARALIDLGAALRRSGRRVDARPRLRDGLELAARCNAPRDIARARSELRAAGSRARVTTRAGLDALTPSEYRVAVLAAQGRSNPEIAQDLFVTRKTVEMHLSGAYRKLDIRSRSELPAIVSP